MFYDTFPLFVLLAVAGVCAIAYILFAAGTRLWDWLQDRRTASLSNGWDYAPGLVVESDADEWDAVHCWVSPAGGTNNA
jgi:hypothetical protein